MQSDEYQVALKWWRSMDHVDQYDVWRPWVLTARKPVPMKHLHHYEFYLLDVWKRVMENEEDGLQVASVDEA